MRPPTVMERNVVRWFAERVDEHQRQSLLSDLDHASAEEIQDEQLTIRFDIEGYTRPPYRGECPLPIDAMVLDADGEHLAVILSADENGRLFELQVIRFERGPVLRPEWATLRQLAPEEVIDLGMHSPEIRKWPPAD